MVKIWRKKRRIILLANKDKYNVINQFFKDYFSSDYYSKNRLFPVNMNTIVFNLSFFFDLH